MEGKLQFRMLNSDIFITLDSDDINFPQRAARCSDTLTGPIPKLIYTRVLHFSDSNPSKKERDFTTFQSKLLEMINYITNPGTAFNRARSRRLVRITIAT